MSRRVIRFVAGMMAVFFLFLMVACVEIADIFQGERVVRGVWSGGIDLHGLNRTEGMEKCKEKTELLRSQNVRLLYSGMSWDLNLGQVGVEVDAERIMDEALRVGRTGSLLERWRERRQVAREGVEIPFYITLDKVRLVQQVGSFLRDYVVEPREATFRILENDQIEVIPAKDGLQVDYDALYRDLVAVISAQQENPSVQIKMMRVKPARSTRDIEAMRLKGLLAAYVTQFDPSQTERSYNIRVAAAALDGLLVPPGQEVSFNSVVGPRSSDAGYKNAQVIINDELVQGMGGGVCQVSSTLLNAVLLANLKVTERLNHSLPVSYVPIGRDATVVYGATDLRFLNNTDGYIFIKTAVYGNKLVCKIYGDTDHKKDVEIRSKIIKVIEPEVTYEKDPNLKKGDKVIKRKGSRGYRVETVRVVRDGGRVTVEKLFTSFYHPVNEVVAVGTKEIKPTILTPIEDESELPEDETLTGEGKDPTDVRGETSGDGQEEVPHEQEQTDGFGTEESGEQLPVAPVDGSTAR